MSIVNELQNQIELLIQTEQWQKAYQLCNEILNADPENRKIIKLQKQILDVINQRNRAIIKKEIQELEKLKKSGDYQNYFEQISRYQTYIKDLPELADKILEARTLYLNLLQNLQTEQIENKKKEILQLFETNRLEAIKKAQYLVNSKVANSEIQHFYQQLRQDYVNAELKDKKKYFEGDRFEDILLTLFQLNQFDPKNSKVINLTKKIQKRYQHHKIEQRQDFIYKLLEELNTLMQTKQYLEALKIADKILEIDQTNRVAIKVRSKAEKGLIRNTDRKIADQIEANFLISKKEYHKNPAGYVKI